MNPTHEHELLFHQGQVEGRWAGHSTPPIRVNDGLLPNKTGTGGDLLTVPVNNYKHPPQIERTGLASGGKGGIEGLNWKKLPWGQREERGTGHVNQNKIVWRIIWTKSCARPQECFGKHTMYSVIQSATKSRPNILFFNQWNLSIRI